MSRIPIRVVGRRGGRKVVILTTSAVLLIAFACGVRAVSVWQHAGAAAPAAGGSAPAERSREGGIPQTDRWLTAFIDSYNAGWAARDLEGWLTLLAEDAEFVSPYGVTRGRSAIGEAAERGLGLGWSLKFVERRRIIQGSSAAWEGVWEAFFGPPSKAAKVPRAMIIQFNAAGKVQSAHIYYDAKDLEQQLRQPPGGAGQSI